MGLEIYEFNGEGYKPMLDYNGWRVALVNSAERLLDRNICKMERHLETDEVFALISGQATLYIGQEKKKYIMELGKIYNVKCGEWHCISMTENSKVIVIENSNTGEKNSEYHYEEGIQNV